jgi:CDP-4-dehydro-6-deoxyglucose reductase
MQRIKVEVKSNTRKEETVSSLTFFAEPDETLLSAAASAGLFFPHSCKTGRCKTCRCKVVSGSTRLVGKDEGLSDEEKADGWILTCVRAAEAGLRLDSVNVMQQPLPPVKLLPARISAIDVLSKDVVRVRLRVPSHSVINYYPGQYINVTRGGCCRSYSIANAPKPDGMIELHIRRVLAGNMSSYWFECAAIGDLLHIQGPYGTFFLNDYEGRDLIFLATGTGFAPIKAILEGVGSVPPALRPRSIHVYWGGRSAEDFYTEVPDFGFDCVVRRVISRTPGHQRRTYVPDFGDMIGRKVFACGSPKMIESARELLTGAGLEEFDFFADAFVSSGG